MKVQINKTKFISGFEKAFNNNLNAKSEAGLSFLIDKLNQEDRLDNICQFAYFLATVYHESTWAPSKSYFVPIKEGKAGSRTEVWIKYQSKYWNSGYYGRGYVQTTLEDNYRNAGILLGLGSEFFINDPDEMLEPEHSYESAIRSMVRGLYRKNKKTGRRESLDVYLSNENAPDYVNARNIINGDVKKNGKKIADEAVKFERLIRQCLEKNDGRTLVSSGNNSNAAVAATNDSVNSNADLGSAATSTTIKTDNVELTSTSNQETEAGNEQSFQAMIPQIDTARTYLKSLFSGGVFAAVGAFWLGLPMWVQVSLVVFVIVVVIGGIALFIRYYKDVFGFVTAMNTLRATQNVGNPLLTKPEKK